MRTNGRFAVIVGVLLLIEGAWGLFSPVVFGRLTTNLTHAVIHLLLGAAAIWAARNSHASGYATFLGLLLLVVSALWFISSTRATVVRLLNVNQAVAVVNAVVGAISLLIGIATRADVVRR